MAGSAVLYWKLDTLSIRGGYGYLGSTAKSGSIKDEIGVSDSRCTLDDEPSILGLLGTFGRSVREDLLWDAIGLL